MDKVTEKEIKNLREAMEIVGRMDITRNEYLRLMFVLTDILDRLEKEKNRNE